MHKTYAVPRTPVIKVPKLDRFIAEHLDERLPKSRANVLGIIQSALLSAEDSLTCLGRHTKLVG